MLIDLDRFKPVNDVHGHAAGNAVLCAVADRMRDLFRQGAWWPGSAATNSSRWCPTMTIGTPSSA